MNLNDVNKHKYNWKRFWCPRGGHINLSDGGFLYDPESEYSYYHPRILNLLRKYQTFRVLFF
jgi:hypothetical protein